MTVGELFIVGLGPGSAELLTPQARAAIERAEVLIGYRGYLDQLPASLEATPREPSELGQEVERAERAVALACSGRRVAVVSSGDAGVYGMASPVLEALERHAQSGERLPQLAIVPGVTAGLAAAALLGAPLGADFATISLSDLLTPWERIERRLALAAEADFVIVLYNPASRRRGWQFERACQLISRSRAATTPVALVRQACRPDQQIELTDLASAPSSAVDMTTIVVIGCSTTRRFDRWLITPRGYR